MSDDFDFDKEYEDAIPDDGAWKAELDLKDNEPRKNLFNACVALRSHPALAGKLAYDEFSGATVVRGPLPWDDRSPRAWTEADDLKATEWLQAPEVGVLVGSAITREAVQSVAHENRFHPVLEYLEGLEWDGEERLGNWLTTYLGVPRSPLADAFGRKFLISAVARVYRPGCKVDHALILEGLQGALKSKTLRALVGDDWFTDQIADLGTKDSCQDLRGVWVVELSELSAIRPGEVERVKAFFSRQVDHYRPSYGRRSIDVPRQTVFIGTTNDREYLSDPTGNRRYWPVTCTELDPDAIARDRDQLWAEAVAAFHAGETWWLEDDELRRAAAAEQEERRIADPWEATIAAWLENPTQRPDEKGIRAPLTLENGEVTISQILDHTIVKPAERQSKSDQMRVGKILALLGWRKRKGHRLCLWYPQGVSADEVSAQGGRAETSGNRAFQYDADTADTYSARTYEGTVPLKQNHETGVAGDRGVSASPNGEDRERIGTCAYCRDAAYADNALQLPDGRVFHRHCAELPR